MAADYSGAVGAIRNKFVAEWISAPATPRSRIAFVNEPHGVPWPPKLDNGKLAPWVLLEIASLPRARTYPGRPGGRTVLYEGHIYTHVYVPIGAGTEQAIELAVLGGEIFRDQVFYRDVTPGCYVRTGTPAIAGGEAGDDENQWYRVSAATPFEYWHRG